MKIKYSENSSKNLDNIVKTNKLHGDFKDDADTSIYLKLYLDSTQRNKSVDLSYELFSKNWLKVSTIFYGYVLTLTASLALLYYFLKL